MRPSLLGALAVGPLLLGLTSRPFPSADAACDADNGGLVLPTGFCAGVVASGLGPVRQLAVAPNGNLYAALSGKPGDNTGGVLAFRLGSDGKAEERASFGPGGGNDVKIHGGYLYFALDNRVVRYRLDGDRLEPDRNAETVVADLPADGGHQAKSLAFGPSDAMYVNIGSATNSCQETDRLPASPGKDPCRELEQRAGIWRFSASRVGQRFSGGNRYATGLRNAMALAVQPGTNLLFAAVHGRDQLSDNWGFSDTVNADNPGEELAVVREGDDYGWPYCYYSNQYRHKVLAPEYGGDGKKVGRCSAAKDPVLSFPGHWAPMAMVFYSGPTFGAEYTGGLFIAFHGSWNREPLPQAGYRVSFVPFAEGKPTGKYFTFASGVGGPTELRASGVAVGPDGSLYISADRNGKIWRVVKRGER